MLDLRGRAACWRVSWMSVLIERCCDNTARDRQPTQRFLDVTIGQERRHGKKKSLAKSRDAHEERWIDLSTKVMLPPAALAICMLAENYLHLQPMTSKKTLKCSEYCSDTAP
jgi:hypothetical protein